MVLELNASNQVVRAYINGPGLDQPIERIEFINGTARNRQVFHTDGLGSVSVLTDENGATIQAYAYEAFGKIRIKSATDLNRVTYTAREAIGDSLGFYYYRNRVLDSITGRFTSEDPLGFVDGPSRYMYVNSNPIIFIDPFGLQQRPWYLTPQSNNLGNFTNFNTVPCANTSQCGNACVYISCGPMVVAAMTLAPGAAVGVKGFVVHGAVSYGVRQTIFKGQAALSTTNSVYP